MVLEALSSAACSDDPSFVARGPDPEFFACCSLCAVDSGFGALDNRQKLQGCP
jgi:hypothetical protein